METEQTEQVTPESAQEIPRTSQEKRADSMCEALEDLCGLDQKVIDVIWDYFRDGQDHLAFMLMQTVALDTISGDVEEIQMSIDRLADDDGYLTVKTWEQN